jgi:uncharacterized membrane protein (UPF0127 family)
MTTAFQSFMKRAAICVALFVVATIGLPSPIRVAGLVQFTSPAYAKMRRDKLTIEPAAGGPAHAFDIEVASSEQEKQLGLMYRTAIGDSEGMLFPNEAERQVSMWMRNTYIPLDMVFIRSDGMISRIEERAEPLSDRVIAAGTAVAAVLELQGGTAARLGIKPGDKVRYRLFKNAAP